MEKIKNKLLDMLEKYSASQSSIIVNPAANLFEQGILDSFTMVRLITEIEKEFSVKINSDDLSYQNFSTLNELSRLVYGLLSAK